eukprot:TRINITY_DN20990_c0_g1_i1.p1 TRINITY_DN20990_c0_g1~~TRINITY_DN20990_c0_g1_i1.p1  ORF type:complete len:286 (+),score=48.41 TRINITY_DN20990_c0_g1_i1:99-860(+)
MCIRDSNSITPEIAVRLAAAWQLINADGQIRAVVLTGSGDRAFCSGADLRRLISLLTGAREPAPGDPWDRALKEKPSLASEGMLQLPVLHRPIIAAINGSAIAGGMEVVEATDIRVAAEPAMFGLPQAKLGLFPTGSTVKLPRQIPYCHAMELLLTGNLVSARKALEMGLVNYVVPGSQVLERAIQIAECIAANSPAAVKAIRESVKACSAISELDHAINKEAEFSRAVFQGPDAREGPVAFLEKRIPRWSKL